MAAKKLRVLLCIPDLQDLGVQHDIRCLMKFWDRDAFEPVMLLHKREGAFADQFPPEMKSIEVDPLSFAVPRARVLTRIAGYARAFRYFDPDAVISFVPYSNLASVWARVLSRKNFGLAVSEHAHVTASLRDPESFTGLFSWYYRRNFASLYNQRADLVKCIAAESVRDLVDHHGIKPERVRLIYNPVDMEEVAKLSREPVDDPWLGDAERARTPVVLNVGRLVQQKRQDLLLRAFARVRKERQVRLFIVGRGPHLSRLQALAAELGVADDVRFAGFQKNPWRFMGRAAMLAMSSEWEGLPCVITEAMSLGLPIVASRCPSGPAEMLLEGKGGLLVPVDDVDALAHSMREILANPDAARARAAVATAHLDRFRPEQVTRQYEALARELAAIGAANRT